MKLELDKRIPNQNCIFTCFDTECAEQYVGKQGYFTNCYTLFANINSLVKGTLTKICDSSVNEKYYTGVGEKYYSFFLPEDLLKPEEKKYRPFKTTHDLDSTQLYLGCIIDFVNTKFLDVVHRAIINEITYDDNTEELIDITLGNTTYSFESLFNDYQLLGTEGKWIPFGKKVEEE